MGEKNVLHLNNERGEEIAPFINEKDGNEIRDVTSKENLLEETFLVESININRVQVEKLRPVVDSRDDVTFCLGEQSCADCIERLNKGDARWLKTNQDKYIEECIRLCCIDLSTELSHKEIKKGKVNESDQIVKEQKDKLFGVLMRNRKVFSNKLGK